MRADTPASHPLAKPELVNSKGYDKELLKEAATILVDCINNPDILTAQQSLEEVSLPEDQHKVYEMLLEFAAELAKKYDIEVSQYEVKEFPDKDEDWPAEFASEQQAEPEEHKDDAVGGTA